MRRTTTILLALFTVSTLLAPGLVSASEIRLGGQGGTTDEPEDTVSGDVRGEEPAQVVERISRVLPPLNA